ncbi:hypothetical protein BAUCODRAFT_79168 [Baudoinia panamericana UAMH 10762]|uniref:ISWI chromatin-remodeling complex ATPase ISW2 n=1 Tax=Baudoinia panamericana (strain UAMH 10762) TaxID=717646 RepID=M2MZE5_BAUPA|nr:uncharacterized protein BAUCODRAFT_79168 [Baudoinia panamericana UAMH 10762]EMC91705.1 hypothetical protein BAUCODRAFT_79168 [Baudoinia panamericana UAMH 10762]
MQRRSTGRDTQTAITVNYADPSSPSDSPTSASSFDNIDSSKTSLQADDESEDELQSGTIHVKSRTPGTRDLPARSTRSQVSYAKPVKGHEKKSAGRSKRKVAKILVSNTAESKAKPPAETARAKVRQAIAELTKPKRDAFILKHKNYFLPLLPASNYIAKRQVKGIAQTGTVEYATITQQPAGIKATMKPYQMEGLSFLQHMYRNGMPAILGDEMGLGKTLQTLSLFEWLKENEADSGEKQPHLIVCPLSVLSSWMNETKKWTDFKAVRFHGPRVERNQVKQELLGATDVDIIVTTYDTFKAEAGYFKRAFAYKYCVLDEGHKIKNEQSEVSEALQSLQAEYRLLLTGTPLQNNLKEMWALIHWLLPDVFPSDTAAAFKAAFDLTQGKVSTTFMDDSRRLLELLMIRRMKSSPGVDLGLPPKEEVLLYVPLTPMQRFWYTRLLTKVDTAMLEDVFKRDISADASDDWKESRAILQQTLEQEQREGSDRGKGHWSKLMSLITRLRQVCSHPYLLKSALPEPYHLGNHVKTASGKFIVLDKLVQRLVIEQRKKVLIFSGYTQTLDLCEDLLALKGANHIQHATFRYLRFDGSTARANRNLGIRLFNQPESDFRVMLISTRAGGLGINLASASDVIFLDEDWNPMVSAQAEARAHRIGQTRPVTVYKICTRGTVEEQMLGRIRKKLYLSVKITESMRNIHGTAAGQKRKHSDLDYADEASKLNTDQLKSLLRLGAQTLTHAEVDVEAMLDWDFATMIAHCKDKTVEHPNRESDRDALKGEEEQAWLNNIERVETAVFEGKRHHRQLDDIIKAQHDLVRADRRINKNTTVMVDGYAIAKESMLCADWEAVPTLAGKDPRLAEPTKMKKEAITNQDYCQCCLDGGEVVLCSGCPRSYHIKCLDKDFKALARGKMNFFCPQHCCRDCGAKTAEAGGMIYRCRWCERGYCEDCLDFDNSILIGDTMPEYEMLGFGARSQAYYVECSDCIEHWKEDEANRKMVLQERKRIEKAYAKHLKKA